MKKGKVTGIGGIFFKCDDPDKMREWYGNTFGFETDKYGAMFKSKDFDNPSKTNYLQWSTMSKDSKYFDPSKSQFMVNYRVENIEALVEQLKAEGVKVVDEIEEFEYGKFVHVLDPEGNKIELWEPVDEAFD
ncbi:MAG: VOC family protein [Bacteroidia bacterium]